MPFEGFGEIAEKLRRSTVHVSAGRGSHGSGVIIRLAPGNSGGPLADVRGRLVGINTMIAGGIGMAVPSNSVARFLDRSIENRSGIGLGVVMRRVSVMIDGKTARGMGFVIREIANGSPAESASLMPGDILVGADDVTFEWMDDLEQALQGHGERVVRLQFLRGDRLRVRTVAVRLCSPHVAAA